MDNHSEVALVRIPVHILGGEGLPVGEAQGVPWPGGDGGALECDTVPGTPQDMISQEPQSTCEVDVSKSQEKGAALRSQRVFPAVTRPVTGVLGLELGTVALKPLAPPPCPRPNLQLPPAA